MPGMQTSTKIRTNDKTKISQLIHNPVLHVFLFKDTCLTYTIDLITLNPKPRALYNSFLNKTYLLHVFSITQPHSLLVHREH